MDPLINLLIKCAIIALFIAIILACIRWIISSLVRTNEMRKKQNLSVIARWRNKITKDMWEDMMDIRIAGIIPVGESVENFLYAMFPKAMGDLEELREKNPVAFREVMAYLLPLFVRIKATAHYKGQDALQSILGSIEDLVQGNLTQDKDGIQDPDNGKTGGRTG